MEILLLVCLGLVYSSDFRLGDLAREGLQRYDQLVVFEFRSSRDIARVLPSNV